MISCDQIIIALLKRKRNSIHGILRIHIDGVGNPIYNLIPQHKEQILLGSTFLQNIRIPKQIKINENQKNPRHPKSDNFGLYNKSLSES